MSSPLNNLNKGYAKQEKSDLMNDNPIASRASVGSFMSQHTQSGMGGSPLMQEGGKDKHSNIMNDTKRGPNPEGGVSDAERWARHQKGAPHHGGKPGGDSNIVKEK